jgi:hypothetical protein
MSKAKVWEEHPFDDGTLGNSMSTRREITASFDDNTCESFLFGLYVHVFNMKYER